MKKIILILTCIFIFSLTAFCDNERPIKKGDLPQNAQTFISQHFKKEILAYCLAEGKEFKVYFSNGNKVEFDKNGEWTEVKCKVGNVPSDIVPDAIKNHIKSTFGNQKIVKIEKNKNGYDVELTNDLDILFDCSGQFIRVDD
ncbi:MAG: PepSY-like domain-containing protein [Bacteroidales bacterium]|nr:PepSY-like domain-containing protein [Bacteroidales bacterium]